MGNQPAAEAGLGARSSSQRWIALPGAPQAGVGRLDHFGMEYERTGATGEVLFADPRRPAPPRSGGGALAARLLGDYAGPATERSLKTRLLTKGVDHAVAPLDSCC